MHGSKTKLVSVCTHIWHTHSLVFHFGYLHLQGLIITIDMHPAIICSLAEAMFKKWFMSVIKLKIWP